MSAFGIITTFFIIALLLNIVVMWSPSSLRFSEARFGVSIAVIVTLIIMGLVALLWPPDTEGAEWEDGGSVEYEIEPIATGFKNYFFYDEHAYGIDEKPEAKVYFRDAEGKGDDAYYTVLYIGGDHPKDVGVHMPASQVEIRTVGEGEQPHLVVNEQHTRATGFAGKDSEAKRYTYIIYVNDEDITQGDKEPGDTAFGRRPENV